MTYLYFFSSRPALVLAMMTGVLGVAFCAFIMQRAWREQSRYYDRYPTQDITLHPERTGIAGLAQISFAAAGDPPVSAWYAPSKNRAAIILLHGRGAERSSLLAETKLLAQAGFGVLALDAPGQGRSAGVSVWGAPERRALSAAVDWLARREDVDPKRIGGFGLSLGGYLLTQAAVADKRIAALVLASSAHDIYEFSWLTTRRWGWLSQVPTYLAMRAAGTPTDMRAKDIAWQLAPRPVLLIHGERDTLVEEWMMRQIFDNARAPKEFYTVAGAGHSDFMQVAPEAYGARVVAFFSSNLLETQSVQAPLHRSDTAAQHPGDLTP